jgi:hypothetical protein
MALSTTSPSLEEVKEALQEYFAPDGSEQFTNIYVKIRRKNDDGEIIEKLLTNFQIVVEGERSRQETDAVQIFDFIDDPDDDE